jgi:hypothetical protein
MTDPNIAAMELGVEILEEIMSKKIAGVFRKGEIRVSKCEITAVNPNKKKPVR